MLMIGSTGANVGKTELATKIIKKFGADSDIIGVKVTTIKAKDGQCPRGGQGCGVCSSLKGDFCITEETNPDMGKDTSRLLAAGASRVLWLRVLQSSVFEGMTSLLEITGPKAVMVCESNSLRHVVEPGLFLMVDTAGSRSWKSSAKNVKEYVDRVVISDGRSFNFDIDEIKLVEGKWTIPVNAAAIILSGGTSRRMGTDKSMLSLKDKTMIEHISSQLSPSFSEVLISADDKEKYSFLGFKVIPDKMPGQGPLMGIGSSIEASEHDLNFVVACDIPNIAMYLVRRMLNEADGFDIVVPATGNENYEPLFAVYRKSSLEAIRKVLKSGGRKISDIFDYCKVKYIRIEPPDWLKNLNTMDDYEEFRKKFNAEI